LLVETQGGQIILRLLGRSGRGGGSVARAIPTRPLVQGPEGSAFWKDAETMRDAGLETTRLAANTPFSVFADAAKGGPVHAIALRDAVGGNLVGDLSMSPEEQGNGWNPFLLTRRLRALARDVAVVLESGEQLELEPVETMLRSAPQPPIERPMNEALVAALVDFFVGVADGLDEQIGAARPVASHGGGHDG